MPIRLADAPELETQAAVAVLDAYPPATVDAYDRGPSSGQDSVGPAEIGRLIVIEALSQAVAAQLVEAAIAAPWHLVPIDARLADADPEGDLYWQAARLFDHFTSRHAVGDAIASKLLHLKRPAFFPILDAVVREAYDQTAREAYGRGRRVRRERPHVDRLYWAAIRADLLRGENQAALAILRAALVQSEDPHRQHIAVVSDVRLIDMLVWRRATAAPEVR